MPKLPTLKPKEVIKRLKKAGFSINHITGSHYILYKTGHSHPVTVPMHNKDLKPGTLFSIIHQSGFTLKQFMRLK